ncbi:MAG: FtsW/RodA/SpoVE family cell cycle protein [Cyclobacteriaceae bacterium]|jgi:cell division protein FtsW|nr:FtsW/RodA/SpoVE family cell cycle protein [Cyclobacteriaceae bacterium]
MIKEWTDRHIQGDPVIWLIVLALSILSVLVVYSATGTLAYTKMEGNTEHYLFKHSSFMLMSLFAMWVAHKIDYRYYAKLSRLALWLCVPLLFITWQFGTNINEATRWITIPLINQTFQPSDLAKFALIVTLASMLAKRQDKIDDVKEALIPMLLWIGVICGLIAMSNFSTAILVFTTCMLMLFIGRVSMKYLFLLIAIGIVAGGIALAVGQRAETVISRVQSFIAADEVPYQAEQSYIAIAKGGLIRFAPGGSTQRNFLPSPYSDFIYAIVIEEYGLVGGVFVLFLYLALLYRGTRMVSKSERTYGGLLAAGLSFALVFQAMVNMGVAVGLGPITGLTLPLVSMGGTSQLFTGIAIGIVLSVSRGEIEEVASNSSSGNKFKKVVEIA